MGRDKLWSVSESAMARLLYWVYQSMEKIPDPDGKHNHKPSAGLLVPVQDPTAERRCEHKSGVREPSPESWVSTKALRKHPRTAVGRWQKVDCM